MRITLGVTAEWRLTKPRSSFAVCSRKVQRAGGNDARGAGIRRAADVCGLSGQKVITDLFGDSSGGEANLESAIEHIAVAQRRICF